MIAVILIGLNSHAESGEYFKPLWSAAKKEFYKAGAKGEDRVYVVFAVDQMEGVSSLIKSTAQAQRNLFSVWKDGQGRLTTCMLKWTRTI